MNQPSNISEAARRATEAIGPYLRDTPAFLDQRIIVQEHIKRALQQALSSAQPVEGERIGGFRITPQGLKMNGPTPPTQKETAAYLAHEKADIVAANEALSARLQKAEELLREAKDNSHKDPRFLSTVMVNAAKWDALMAFLNSKTP